MTVEFVTQELVDGVRFLMVPINRSSGQAGSTIFVTTTCSCDSIVVSMLDLDATFTLQGIDPFAAYLGYPRRGRDVIGMAGDTVLVTRSEFHFAYDTAITASWASCTSPFVFASFTSFTPCAVGASLVVRTELAAFAVFTIRAGQTMWAHRFPFFAREPLYISTSCRDSVGVVGPVKLVEFQTFVWGELRVNVAFGLIQFSRWGGFGGLRLAGWVVRGGAWTFVVSWNFLVLLLIVKAAFVVVVVVGGDQVVNFIHPDILLHDCIVHCLLVRVH